MPAVNHLIFNENVMIVIDLRPAADEINYDKKAIYKLIPLIGGEFNQIVEQGDALLLFLN